MSLGGGRALGNRLQGWSSCYCCREGRGNLPTGHHAPGSVRWESREKKLLPRMKRSKHVRSPCLPQKGSLDSGRPRKRNLGWALGATEAGEPPLLGFNTEGGPSRGSGPQFQRHCPFCSHPPFNGVPESSSPCWVRERGQKLSGPTPSPPQRSSAMLFLPLFLLSTPISDLALDLSPFPRSF